MSNLSTFHRVENIHIIKKIEATNQMSVVVLKIYVLDEEAIARSGLVIPSVRVTDVAAGEAVVSDAVVVTGVSMVVDVMVVEAGGVVVEAGGVVVVPSVVAPGFPHAPKLFLFPHEDGLPNCSSVQ